MPLCLEQIAADEGVDAIIAVTVPTAVSDLHDAITTAVLSKLVAVALLDQPESVRLLPREAAASPEMTLPQASAEPTSGEPAHGAAGAPAVPAVPPMTIQRAQPGRSATLLATGPGAKGRKVTFPTWPGCAPGQRATWSPAS
jgi:hypothetical protein